MSDIRLERLRARLAELNIAALLVSQPENRRYLSGFTGSAGWLLITPTLAQIITDSRYYEQVAAQAPAFALVKQNKTFKDAFRQAVRAAGAKTIAFESHNVSVAQLRDMEEALKGPRGGASATMVATTDVVEPLRAVKEESEIAAIARAAEITDQALAAALPGFKAGMTELEASWEIERRMRELGAQGTAFELIVAAGPNSALPHARPGERRLQLGQPIVLDIGARVDGYASDMTRTICLGKETPRFHKIYGIVLEAQQAALKAIKAGVTGKEVDGIARAIISNAGYGPKFGHSLGHGVGLAIHESPLLSFRTVVPKPLLPGMVVTVEPGIYLPGWGGVRIEDSVVVTEDGARILTHSPK